MVVSTAIEKFGSLKVLRIARKDHFGRPIALCICDCGNTCHSPLASLKQGDIKSCGECRPSKAKTPRVRKKTGNLLIGQIFNYLSVIDLAETRKGIKYYYCLCKCGNSKIAQHYRLLEGQVKSCGCIRKQPKKSLQPRTDGTYIGVYQSRKNWIARIHHDGNKIAIGSFPTQKEAVLARNKYIRKHRLEEWHLVQNIN